MPSRFLAALMLLSASGASAAEPASGGTLPHGQRIFICGHSFHMPVGNMLPEVAEAAGIMDQVVVGQQRMNGSTVEQHWALDEPENQLKVALHAGSVDVITLSPTAKQPDEGIPKFVEMGLEKNPKLRVMVQASWVGWDSPNANPRTFKNENRDTSDPSKLHEVYDPYYKIMCEQARGLNEQYKREAVFVVPVAYAVFDLRQKVAAGQVPGIAKQSDLFKDDRGHGKAVIYLLATYCNYAVIYGRSPIGLAAPAVLKKDYGADVVEKLNRVLEEVAWEAVTTHPLTGVTK